MLVGLMPLYYAPKILVGFYDNDILRFFFYNVGIEVYLTSGAEIKAFMNFCLISLMQFSVIMFVVCLMDRYNEIYNYWSVDREGLYEKKLALKEKSF